MHLRHWQHDGALGRSPLLLLALLWASPLTGQETTVPSGVSVEQVDLGLRLYHTEGACDACHGKLGVGSADGPQLIVGQWKLGPGTYVWLQHITRHAGWGATSREGDPQPMRGPTVLDSAEVNAVAAYVWSISRGRAVTKQP